MEKIRQICVTKGGKVISRSDIREVCDFVEESDGADLENVLEKLNFMGFMIKLNSEEFQIV